MGFEGLKPLGAAVKMGGEFFANEAADEFLQLSLGDKVVSAGASEVDGADSTKGAEYFETLASGAFADLEAAEDIVEGEGLGGNVEETVDFSNGFGEAEDTYAIDEEVDDTGLELTECARGSFVL